ncbi:MAG: carbon-nitrogen hydrolase family protein [Armatimonadetes bacterium]|nr:carbon-nitrogen hydrolase family protein [Armatimonadota bacterium]
MSRRVTIASLQINMAALPSPTTAEANRQLCAAAIDEAAGYGADVICLPECCTTANLPPDDPERLEPLPGPSFALWAERARRHRLVVVGWQYELDGERYHNTGFVIDRDGQLVGRYRKVHSTPNAIANGEVPGDEFPVFETDFGRVGMMICYDAYFPEQARILALKGAEIIFYPTMSDARHEPIWELVARSRAVDNGVYVVSAVMRNSYMAYSGIFAPSGHVVAARQTWAGGLAVGTIDLDERFRSEGHSGIAQPADLQALYWYSRRPEVYGELCALRHDLDLEAVQGSRAEQPR